MNKEKLKRSIVRAIVAVVIYIGLVLLGSIFFVMNTYPSIFIGCVFFVFMFVSEMLKKDV